MQLSSGLLCAGRQWQRMADQRLQPLGITSACAMPLMMVQRAGGGIRQVALAQQLGMEGPSLVRLLDKLCADGLMRRQSDASDRRAKLLWLTDAGEALVERLEQTLIRLREEVFGAMDEQQLRVVLKLWDQLAEASAKEI